MNNGQAALMRQLASAEQELCLSANPLSASASTSESESEASRTITGLPAPNSSGTYVQFRDMAFSLLCCCHIPYLVVH